jgi:hypothetical protein
MSLWAVHFHDCPAEAVSVAQMTYMGLGHPFHLSVMYALDHVDASCTYVLLSMWRL